METNTLANIPCDNLQFSANRKLYRYCTREEHAPALKLVNLQRSRHDWVRIGRVENPSFAPPVK